MGSIFDGSAFSVSGIASAILSLASSNLGRAFLVFGLAPIGLLLVYRLAQSALSGEDKLTNEEWALFHSVKNDYKARGGMALSRYEKQLISRGNRRAAVLSKKYSGAARSIDRMGMPTPQRRSSSGYRPRSGGYRRRSGGWDY